MLNAAEKLFLLCLIAVSPMWQAFAQEEINFTSSTTKEGLSSNMVTAILKEKHGLKWFGTDDSLVKSDGINFIIYRQRSGDSTSLPANDILALNEDKAGRLWIGTSGGSLALYNLEKDAFVRYPSGGGRNSIGNNVIRSLWSDHLGQIWIAHSLKIESADEVLLHKIAVYIEEHLTDTQLSVENLSRHVAMSRTSLYSKLLEITGRTPLEYIRSVKLEKAALLLRNSDLNVAQIAYTVGFSTPNYFAKAFKEKI